MAKRLEIPDSTKRYLLALSGNQCANPSCTNRLYEPGTAKSDFVFIGNQCHIYAVSDNGPRARPELTQDERRAPKNLIVLCRNCHAVVDGQPETYPDELLKQWKKAHEDQVTVNQRPADIYSLQPNMFPRPNFPVELIDKKIKEEIDTLRKSRSFPEIDRVNSALILARKLMNGELVGGTATVRCRALAWCVRILSIEDRDKAEECLKFAQELGACEEIDIASAFILSQKDKKKAALSALAPIDSPMSRSAALMIVVHHNGPQGAVDWLKTAGLNATALDSDGKRLLLGCQFELADWEAAQECLGLLTDDDLRDTPSLHHMKAITHLLRAVPDELCSGVLYQIPFEAADFPLDDSSPSSCLP